MYHADTTGNNHALPSPAADTQPGATYWFDLGGGNVYGKSEFAMDDDIDFADGSRYSYYAALHEIGHALGLRHPEAGDYDSNYDLRKTVMSYNIPGSTGQGGTPFSDYWAITPMA